VRTDHAITCGLFPRCAQRGRPVPHCKVKTGKDRSWHAWCLFSFGEALLQGPAFEFMHSLAS